MQVQLYILADTCTFNSADNTHLCQFACTVSSQHWHTLVSFETLHDFSSEKTQIPHSLTQARTGQYMLHTECSVHACRVGHETQWTHSKLAEPCDEEDTEESLDACWNCLVPLNIDNNAQAVHLGVYAVQSRELHEGMSRSSSLLSSVSP